MRKPGQTNRLVQTAVLNIVVNGKQDDSRHRRQQRTTLLRLAPCVR
jgi:hypothetical protein